MHLPTSLVVKKGSKSFSQFSAGMPTPVSAILNSAQSSTLRVLIVMRPMDFLAASSMAWAALTIRFKITWLNSPGRHRTDGRDVSKSVSISATYFH